MRHTRLEGGEIHSHPYDLILIPSTTNIHCLHKCHTFHQPGVASFSGPHTIQFLITYSMQSGGPFYLINVINVYLGRQRGVEREQP